MSSENPTQRALRRYNRDMIIAMGLYVISVPFAAGFVNILPEGDAARYLIILIPVVPLIVALFVFMRMLRGIDEFQRKLQFEAFGFSLAVTAIITVTLGFLERAGFPQIGMIWVPMMLIFSWGLGLVIARRKYG